SSRPKRCENPCAMALRPRPSGTVSMSAETSAAWTIFASATSAGSPERLCLSMMLSNEQRPSTWPNSTPLTSNGMAPSRPATSSTSLFGTKRNSAFGSTNRRINQGQAMRSTLASSRVTHFINKSPLSIGSRPRGNSRPSSIGPDLRVFLLRMVRPAGYSEVEVPVVGIEDRRPATLDCGYRPERLVPIRIDLADHRDRALAAGGVDPAMARVERQVVNVAGDRHAGHNLSGIAVHDDQRRILPAADEQP